VVAGWPPEADEAGDYWLSNLPAGTPIEELVRLAKIRWRIEHNYRELKTGFGLDHFEGRSYTGWHRHVTLAALAQASCTLLRTDPQQYLDGLPQGQAADGGQLDRHARSDLPHNHQDGA
jgi:SRSO17 transposase